MPLIQKSSYQLDSFLFKNPHFSTIFMGRVKKIPCPNYTREKIELADGDFISIDYLVKNPHKAVILCHGLEGDSRRNYNNSCANYFLEKDYSVFAWNNRSCGGEMNRLPRLYHHGVVKDLDEVVKYVIQRGFEEIYLIGFSMGGAQIMNYLGAMEIPTEIKSAVAVSTPVKLKSSVDTLKKGFNRVYLNMFTKKIKAKLKAKALQFPESIDAHKIKTIKSFDEIDEYFTAPMHGFKNREDYYKRASPAFVMQNIRTPTLVINALDDPFLGEECYPKDFAATHPFVFLETPKHGGHCAFPQKKTPYSYSEMRAFDFFDKVN